jgi:hypothetical protein
MLSTTASGQVNGLFGSEVQTAADPSTLTVTNTFNGTTGGASVHDSAATGTGDDRYDFLASTNGGVSAATFPVTQSFFISADVTLSGGVNSPRKEAGIRINGTGSNLGNDGQFILDTDAGEIVAFGGNAPFALFGNNSNGVNNTNGSGAPFVNGQTIYMAEAYNAQAGTLTYFAQDLTTGGPLFSSGPNLAYTPPGAYQVGFYNQFTPASATDSDGAVFSNVTVSVPEPASLSILAIGGVALMTRRRAKCSS